MRPPRDQARVPGDVAGIRRQFQQCLWLSLPLAVASGLAFLASETADMLVYSPLKRRTWLGAVFASNVVGLALDSALFLLLALAEESGLRERIDAMFAGEKINVSEHRSVLHVALRMPRDQQLVVDGVDVVAEVHRFLAERIFFALVVAFIGIGVLSALIVLALAPAALAGIARFGADALVVSLGMDTFEGDPISGFKLKTDDYLRIGERLAKAGLPTVFIFEGGYAVEEVGVNAVNVLQGFTNP